jgi:hypothetical protein
MNMKNGAAHAALLVVLPRVSDWLDSQTLESIWTTAITVFELRFRLDVVPTGRRRWIERLPQDHGRGLQRTGE